MNINNKKIEKQKNNIKKSIKNNDLLEKNKKINKKIENLNKNSFFKELNIYHQYLCSLDQFLILDAYSKIKKEQK